MTRRFEPVMAALNAADVRYLFVEEPFDFELAWRRRVEVPLETTNAPVVSREDLIRLKRSSGRPQDLADVAALEEPRPGGHDD